MLKYILCNYAVDTVQNVCVEERGREKGRGGICQLREFDTQITLVLEILTRYGNRQCTLLLCS